MKKSGDGTTDKVDSMKKSSDCTTGKGGIYHKIITKPHV